ncbi:hypothetical protein D3C84_1169130 [compost metagenome]
MCCLFTGQEVAIGGNQQNRCADQWTQVEQAVQVIGDQQVWRCLLELLGAVVTLVVQAPAGQQRL